MNDPNPRRLDFLKSYLIECANEGVFTGMRSPAAIAKKAVSIVARDVPLIIGDFANQAVSSATDHLGDAIKGVAADIMRDGLTKTWSRLQRKYDAGAHILRQRRK